jgi:hypothetical protein
VTTVVQCDDGGYINVASVYRWSITEDVTADGHTILAHVAGPQRPFVVATREERTNAEAVLRAILELAAHVIPGGRSASSDSAGVPVNYHQMKPHRD